MLTNIVIIGFGGFAGSIFRYFLTSLTYKDNFLLPSGCFLVNSIGSFLVGYFYFFSLSSKINLFFVTGFLGSFTTFSLFSLEVVNFLKQGDCYSATIRFLLQSFSAFSLTSLGFLLAKAFQKTSENISY